MKMLTRELEAVLPPLRSTDGKPEEEVMVLAHYFASSWDWWVTEYDPETRTFFGLVRGFEIELGYFSLDELEENSCERRPLGGVERDFYWTPKSLKAVREKLQGGGVDVFAGNQAG